MNKTFSLPRFNSLVKRNIIENRRSLAMTFGTMTGIFFLIAIFFRFNCEDLTYYPSIGIFAMFFIGISFQVTGSLTFNNLAQKDRRIQSLMLPASQWEKFLANILIYVVFGSILLIAGAFLSDLIVNLINRSTPTAFWIFKPDFRDGLFDSVADPKLPVGLLLFAICYSVAMLIAFFQSLFVLGSTLWPQRSFIKTFLALMIFQWVAAFFTPAILNFFSGLNIGHYMYTENYMGVVIRCILVMLVETIIVCGVYALAWWRYKSLQLTQLFLR